MVNEGISVEKAREIRSSELWTHVNEELDFWIHSEEIRLRTCIPDQLKEIQKVIDTLEKVKRLPEVAIGREE